MPSPPPTAAETARRTAEARAAVTASLSSVGASLDHEMRTRTADLHANAAAISKQEKELARQTAGLAKQSAEWDKLLQNGTKKLNEVGDIQNWAEMLERDLLVLGSHCYGQSIVQPSHPFSLSNESRRNACWENTRSNDSTTPQDIGCDHGTW